MTMAQCLIEATHTPYASIHVMLEDIGFALKKAQIGVTHYLFHPEMQTDLYTLLVKELAAMEGPRICFDINGKSNPGLRRTPDGSHLLDQLGIRQITFLVDNPCQHLDHLRKGSDNGILLYLDRDFEPLLKAVNLPYKDLIFFPHGGPDLLTDAAPLPDRPHDILFAGNIFCPPKFQDWLDQIGIADKDLGLALDQAAQRVLYQSDPVFQSLQQELLNAGIEIPLPQLAEVNTRLEHFINGSYRWDMISRLKKTNLTICGDIHRDAKLPNEDHQILGATLFRNILNRVAESKFFINAVPNYRDGAHERVFYGMNRGTVILNSQSRYLEREDKQGLGLRMIPNDLSQVEDWYQAQLADLDLLEQQRPAALQNFLDHHSWSKRLEPVLAAAGL